MSDDHELSPNDADNKDAKIEKYIWVPDSLLTDVKTDLKKYHIDQIEPTEKCWYLKVSGKKSEITQFIAHCNESSAHPHNQHLKPPNDDPNCRVKVANVSPLNSDLKKCISLILTCYFKLNQDDDGQHGSGDNQVTNADVNGLISAIRSVGNFHVTEFEVDVIFTEKQTQPSWRFVSTGLGRSPASCKKLVEVSIKTANINKDISNDPIGDVMKALTTEWPDCYFMLMKDGLEEPTQLLKR